MLGNEANYMKIKITITLSYPFENNFDFILNLRLHKNKMNLIIVNFYNSFNILILYDKKIKIPSYYFN